MIVVVVVVNGWIEEKGGLDSMMKMKERLREMIVVMACDFLIDEPYTPHPKDLIKRRQDISFW